MELKIEMPEAAEEILETLHAHGFEAYVVGGCVRDSLLGRKPGDWDITTSAKPEEVKNIFGWTIDTGIQHGTVTIMKGKVGYEVTTYRIDGEYEDGRHPKEVAFTSNLLEDLKRRDFTINAMAYSPKDGLVDAFGGIEDLKQRRIRCVGNAIDRFTEDALRILRAIRFSAQLGFEIEPETWSAIRVIAPNLVHVSKERIQVELTKLLTSNHPETVQLIFVSGMEAYISDSFAKLDAKQISVSPYLPSLKYLRWADCLKHQSSEDAAKVLKELKLDNDTIGKVKTLVQWWRLPIGETEAQIRRTMSQMTEELFDSLVMLKQAIAEQELSEGRADGSRYSSEVPETREQLEEIQRITEEIRRRGDCISLKTLAVTGSDLIQAGLKPGKQLGEMLNHLLDLVIENPELNQKERLLQEV